MDKLALILRPSEAFHIVDYRLLEYLWWKYPLSFLLILLIAVSQSLWKHTPSILPCIWVWSRAESKPTFLATYTQSLRSLNLSCAFKSYSLLNFYLQHSLLWTLNSKNLNAYLISPFEGFTGISNRTHLKWNLIPILFWPSVLNYSVAQGKIFKITLDFSVFLRPLTNSSAKIIFKIYPEIIPWWQWNNIEVYPT